MASSSRIVKLAYIVAFVLASITAVSSLAAGPVVLPLALIPLIAGIGIKRGRVWSAYGYALFQLANLLIVLPVVMLRAARGTFSPIETIASIAFGALLAVLFVAAGRLLVAVGAERGRAYPWVVVSILCTVPVVFVQAFSIPSAAMENTLLIGDRVIVERWPVPSSHRGDIVVFRYPIDPKQDYVKRVIGIPGDHIRLVNKQLILNGHAVDEPYVKHIFPYSDPYRDDFPAAPAGPGVMQPALAMLSDNVVNGELVVAPGCVFVMGDNRDDSLDSRYYGFVPVENILGQPLLIYWSQEVSTFDLMNSSAHFLAKPRWSRTLKLIHGYPLQ